eukprot:268987-Amphidinium_carterae.2
MRKERCKLHDRQVGAHLFCLDARVQFWVVTTPSSHPKGGVETTCTSVHFYTLKKCAMIATLRNLLAASQSFGSRKTGSERSCHGTRNA